VKVGFNQITLIGTISGNVELRHSQGGVAVATFLLDVPRVFKAVCKSVIGLMTKGTECKVQK